MSRPRVSASLIAVALSMAVIAVVAAIVERREREQTVRVRCVEDACSATVGDGPPLTVSSPVRPEFDRLGLYVFYPDERTAPQYFRDLSVRSRTGKFALALTSERDRARFRLDDGWRTHPGRGITWIGPHREGAIAVLDSARLVDFDLELTLDHSRDAGLLLRAADADNGLVLVVRSSFNDVIFFAREHGMNGAILALKPLRELTLGRESLRLAGLGAEIVLSALLFFVLLRWIADALPDIKTPRTWQWVRDRTSPPAWLVPLMFVGTVIGLTLVAVGGLDGIPHVADEVAYVFQAKIFAAGRLWAPVPDLGDFFRHEHIIMLGDRWFAKYPPLFPALLALGFLAGAPWLVNPLLGALTALATYALTREFSNWRWGVVAWALLLSSPFFVLIGGSLMSHMAAALFVSLAVWMTVRGGATGGLGSAALCGTCIGVALLARPFTALLTCLVVGAFHGIRLILGSRRRATFGRLVTVALCVLPFAAAFLWWNVRLTAPEAPTTNLYEIYDASDRLGFGADKGASWLMTWGSFGHTPAKALRSVHQYLDSTSRHLFGWPGRLSLALVLAALGWGRRRPVFWVVSGLFAALVAGYSLYWATQHLAYGARYWFAAVPGLTMLSALGLRWLSSRPSPRRSPDPRCMSAAAPLAMALVLMMVLWNFAFYFPRRWSELESYAGVRADLARLSETRDLAGSIVFVQTEGLLYNDGFFLNDPLMRDSVIFARDLGERNVELMNAYPERRAYRWTKMALMPLKRAPS